MIDDLLLHPTARFMLHAYIKNPPHAFLLAGPEGIGKRTAGKMWARAVSTLPLYTLAPDEKGSIGIEAVRNLYTILRSKHTARQVVLISNAHTMSHEAQNAFLKLLEEPSQTITFLLTAPGDNSLLPTILSRVQTIHLHPINPKIMQGFLTKQQPTLSQQEIAQQLFIARGRPGAIINFMQNKTQLEKERSFMQQAKQLLNANSYQRYITISKLNDRASCISILQAMLYMGNVQLNASSDKASAARWLKINNALQTALERLVDNGNVKAQLLKLFTSW